MQIYCASKDSYGTEEEWINVYSDFEYIIYDFGIEDENAGLDIIGYKNQQYYFLSVWTDYWYWELNRCGNSEVECKEMNKGIYPILKDDFICSQSEILEQLPSPFYNQMKQILREKSK